jgi:hypothetical protein
MDDAIKFREKLFWAMTQENWVPLCGNYERTGKDYR